MYRFILEIAVFWVGVTVGWTLAIRLKVSEFTPKLGGAIFLSVLMAGSVLCHVRFGYVFISNPASPDNLKPLATLVRDGMLFGAGVRTSIAVTWHCVRDFLRESYRTWLLSLAIGTYGFIVLAVAGMMADDIIRSIAHVLPDRLVGARRFLTTALALAAWICGIYLLALIGAGVAISRGMSLLPRGWVATPYFFAGAAPLILALLYVMPGLATADARAFTFTESLMIVWGSVDSNNQALDDIGAKQSKPGAVLTCTNLTPETLVALMPSRTAAPTEALVADLNSATLSVSFRLAPCTSGLGTETPSNP